MYECPNCGGNLRFDIASQQMACAYCNAQFDPYEITKDKDAEENREFEVTVFTCPQCGGEIYSTDNTAAGFCSFCGASTILNSRLSRERKPTFIIPFKKTKTDCKREYIRMVRKAIFAPKELKNEKYIDGFRGIYMPYWVYHITQNGPIQMYGEKRRPSGDDTITYYYRLSGNLDACYEGIYYDASASFADNISERIAPYDVKNMNGFTPSILSGFYADTVDVEQTLYEEEAKETANKRTRKYIENRKELKEYTLKNDTNLSGQYHTKCESVDIAMFPVWFLSYRNKGRVAYATVNGQTGKVVADLPVDMKKYMAGSLLLAVPLFLLLNAFFTVRPAAALILVAGIALIALILHVTEMEQIVQKEGYRDDKGAMYAVKKRAVKELEQQWVGMADAIEQQTVKMDIPTSSVRQKDALKKKEKLIINIAAWSIFFIKAIGYFGDEFSMLFSFVGGHRIIGSILFIVGGIAGFISLRSFHKMEAMGRRPGFPGAFVAIILAALILIWNPVSDLYYYVGVMAALISVLFTLVDLIRSYNILATRKLPQFDYKGGDDRA